MNNTFSLQHISQTGNLDGNLILQQYKLDLMAGFMEKKSMNPKLGQDQVAKELVCSSSTFKQNRQDFKMLSFCRIPPNSHKKNKRF